MVIWVIELSEYDIEFTMRTNIKSQALADFVVELSDLVPEENANKWTLHVDGSSNLKGSGARFVLEGPGNFVLEYFLSFNFQASNNQAEYKALIAGMKLAK